MKIEKQKVIEKIRKAKEYGLNYSKLAKEAEIPTTSIYQFINGTYNMPIPKQIKIVYVAEKYIAEIEEQIKLLQNSEVCVDDVLL